MNETKSGSAVLFILPLLIISVVFGFVGWVATKMGAGFKLVKLLSFPAPLILSNLMGVLLMGALCFIMSAVSGDKAALTYFFMHLADYSLYIVWGPILSKVWNLGVTDFSMQVTVWLVVVYQVGLWFLLGNRLSNMLVNLMFVFSNRPISEV